jgi:hypothetical protein
MSLIGPEAGQPGWQRRCQMPCVMARRQLTAPSRAAVNMELKCFTTLRLLLVGTSRGPWHNQNAVQAVAAADAGHSTAPGACC